MDAELYPDVAAAGGLAAALAEAARTDAAGAADPVSFVAPDGPDAGWHASAASGDRGVGVTLGIRERAFVVTVIRGPGISATGTAAEPAEVVGVVTCWFAGATLRELGRRFPFMAHTRLAQGYEDGDPVGAQWDEVLADPDLAAVRPLLAAARADGRLGRLFPVVTHRTLVRLLLDHARHNAPQVRIAPAAGGGYRVDADWTQAPRRVSTIDDAIEAAGDLLPSGSPGD